MKYGLMVVKETRNIGDDIQSYATKKFLPRIDYFIDRNHIDEFLPNTEEKVACIINGWFLQYTLNWPPSPYIYPLPISMHFTYKDWFWDTTDRPFHLSGYGLEYLKNIEPIGCRDSHTMKLLKEKYVNSEFSGCLTLTIEKFKNLNKKNYICAVDVSKEVLKKIKDTTNLEIKEITHIVPEDYYNNDWETRMNNVENLLKIYQEAKYIITSRLHCALPATALGTDVLIIHDKFNDDRFKDYFEIINQCSEKEFLEKENIFDFSEKKLNTQFLDKIQKKLNEQCRKFIEEARNVDDDDELISIHDYKRYVIDKSNWLKSAVMDSYKRYVLEKEEKETCKLNIEKYQEEVKKYQGKIKKHQDTILKKDELLQENNYAIEYYKNEVNKCINEIDKYKREIEEIHNSRIWKLRNKIKK